MRTAERSTRSGLAWCGAVLGIALALLLAATDAPGAPSGLRIDIKHHKYSPATLTVAVGATVTWTNHDDDVHTVTSSAQLFTSRGIDTDEAFSYTFTKPGTYVYFCTLHPLMTAKILVK